MNPTLPILKITGLSKTYGGSRQAAVHDFSLEVNRGEIFALLGESGCGKTTILRLIAGFEVPDRGTIILNGKEVCSPGRFTEPEKRGVGIVFQDYALFPNKTVEENISFGLFRQARAERRKITLEITELCGLQGLEKRYPHQISGGQRQRVALARALAPKPAIILFDEPFSNIDTLRKNQMRRDIGEIIRQTGTTAVFVTHDTKDVLALADRVAVLRQGITLQAGTPGEVYRKPGNEYVARFLGKTNLLKGVLSHNGIDTPIGLIPPNSIHYNAPKEVLVSVRPEQLEVLKKKKGMVSAILTKKVFLGEYFEMTFEIRGKDDKPLLITVFSLPEAQSGTLITGQIYSLGLKPGQLPHVF